jgi:hypothetical protein
MNRIEISNKLSELETSLEKALIISDDLFEDYGIQNIADPSDRDKELYSMSCGRISNYLAILNDYVTETKDALNQLKEMI